MDDLTVDNSSVQSIKKKEKKNNDDLQRKCKGGMEDGGKYLEHGT